MRISQIDVTDILPVRRFIVEQLSDIVVIGGPNGVGKSRLIEGLLQKFQNPGSMPSARLVIEATNSTERAEWGQRQLDTNSPQDSGCLSRTLQKNRSRRQWNSGVIHFESDRSIQQIHPYQFTWDVIDPWLESVGWNQTFGGLKSRFQDTLHSLFRKVQSHEKEISRKAIELQRGGAASMPLDFSDPLKAFKDAFTLLVAPKRLLDPDPKQQQLFYEYEGSPYPLSALSSGEREVVNIVFDFILRTASDCIIFFDEPELHLHPELSYKLLQALRATGTRNQFIFCTHSPDIITASLDQTVVFLSPPATTQDGTHKNQAIPVKEDDLTNEALRLLGQSIGVVALGRRLVLIEGTNSSLDKQTYGLLNRSRFPTLVLVPTGGKDLIRSFSKIVENVLEKSIWGVDFFMLCDRDSADQVDIARLEVDGRGRVRFLKRYHLENYFLDSLVIAKMFQDLEPPDSWLRNSSAIDSKLRESAASILSFAVALIVSARIRRRVGNVSIMPKGSHGMSVDELAILMSSRLTEECGRVNAGMSVVELETMIRAEYARLEAVLADPTERWKTEIPGKAILAKFASYAGIELGRFKLLYLATADYMGSSAFADVVSIFSDFSNAKTA